MTDDPLRRLANRYRVVAGKDFTLKDCPTTEPERGIGKEAAEAMLKDGVARLARLQERLYAHGTWSLLVVLQAMDAGGKDGTIKHVMSGVNPQGVTVTAFKAPSAEELAHGFLWRIAKAVPPRGAIGIFNRSHYEDVLVPAVHPEVLAAQHLPAELSGRHLIEDRLRDIRHFEAYLGRQGTKVVKLFLHIGAEEQRQRLLARLDDPAKRWKLDPADIRERARWDDYMDAYQTAIAETAAKEAPWYVIPADQKWYARLTVTAVLIAALEAMDLQPMRPTPAQEADAEAVRKALSGQPS